MKTCKTCGENKDLSEFNKRKGTSDGLYYYCRCCSRLKAKQHRELNKELVKEQRRNNYHKHKEKNRESRNESLRNLYKEDPMPFKTRVKSYNSTLKGKATRLANKKRYELNKIQRTPSWADQEKIKLVYKKAAWLQDITDIELHVDHIIPLRGELVSGLHVENNLQILPAKENIMKSNKLEVAQ